jgi:hypothetical protein
MVLQGGWCSIAGCSEVDPFSLLFGMARLAESVLFDQAPKEASMDLGDGMVQYQCKAP